MAAWFLSSLYHTKTVRVCVNLCSFFKSCGSSSSHADRKQHQFPFDSWGPWDIRQESQSFDRETFYLGSGGAFCKEWRGMWRYIIGSTVMRSDARESHLSNLVREYSFSFRSLITFSATCAVSEAFLFLQNRSIRRFTKLSGRGVLDWRNQISKLRRGKCDCLYRADGRPWHHIDFIYLVYPGDGEKTHLASTTHPKDPIPRHPWQTYGSRILSRYCLIVLYSCWAASCKGLACLHNFHAATHDSCIQSSSVWQKHESTTSSDGLLIAILARNLVLIHRQ